MSATHDVQSAGRWGWLTSNLRSRKHSGRQLLHSPRFVEGLGELAARLKQPLPAVQAQARRAAETLSTVINPAFSALSDKVFSPLFTRAWTIDADHAALARLKQINAAVPLVFLPNHRSYADPFVMAQVCRDAGMPRNHVLGGDNLGFFPFGTITRRTGGVMIRRSFQNDPVYKFVVREYLHHLTAQGNNLEWYMEGGRSRTGKLRPPKYGLLRYLVDAFDGEHDLLLVPVSITYDQLHEIGMMAAEEGGAAKGKEGLGWMREYVRRQRQWIGRVHVRFGEPLSLRQALAPAGAADDAGAGRWTVEKIAFSVFQRINQATPVTAPALTALALLGVRDRALTLAEVCAVVHPLLDYAAQRGLPSAGLEFLRREAGVGRVLADLGRSGVVRVYALGKEPVYSIHPGRHAVAAFYRNSAVHWFINRALLELAMQSVLDEPSADPRPEAWNQAFALRDLLKFDFFFSNRATFRQEVTAEARLLDAHFADHIATPAARMMALEQAPFLVAHRVLPAFVEAYFVVADRLAAQPVDLPVNRAQLIEQCSRIGRQYLLQKRVRQPEALSRELFGNALELAQNRRLLEPGDQLAERRSAFVSEIARAMQALATIDEIDHRRSTTARP
ncbi:MAG: putative acyltransferase plsB1 [Pseudomonadota bacterium]|nr:1-acyl-sn-glycerol-3-phosphate acyltransferase [Rubrivivax sp.]